MLNEIFTKLDVYRGEISSFVEKEQIEAKEKELGIKFSECFKEFYHYYGNDKVVMNADYLFDNIEDIVIEENALCFGYVEQRGARLGIKLEKLEKDKYPSISFKGKNDELWYSEEGLDIIFFFRAVCWQLMISMQGVARIEMDDKQFKSLIGKAFEYLNGEKLFLLSPVIPVVAENILGCYLVREGLLYLGTNGDDEILEDFEEKHNLDLDWL